MERISTTKLFEKKLIRSCLGLAASLKQLDDWFSVSMNGLQQIVFLFAGP